MSDNQVIEEMNIQYPVEDHIQTEIISMENIPEYDIQDYDIFNEKSFNKYIADNKLFESFDKCAFNERVLECLNDLKRNEKYQHCGHFGKPHRSIFESFFR